MNKAERIAAGRKRVAKLARSCGWKEPFNALPVDTQRAFQTRGNVRIDYYDNGAKRTNRKRFGKSTGKRQYGHFCAMGANKHLTARHLRERAELAANIG